METQVSQMLVDAHTAKANAEAVANSLMNDRLGRIVKRISSAITLAMNNGSMDTSVFLEQIGDYDLLKQHIVDLGYEASFDPERKVLTLSWGHL